MNSPRKFLRDWTERLQRVDDRLEKIRIKQIRESTFETYLPILEQAYKTASPITPKDKRTALTKAERILFGIDRTEK